MQTTFSGIGIFPPPASGSNIFTFVNCSCTGLTSYRWISFVVKDVVWDLVLMDICPELFFRPTRQRVDLNKTIYFVPINNINDFAGNGLRCSYITNLRVMYGKISFKSHMFANLTANLTVFDTFVEQVYSLRPYHVFYLDFVGEEHFYLDLVFA